MARGRDSLKNHDVAIREGGSPDMPFVEQMLYEAFFWSRADRPPLVEVRHQPEFAGLLAAWGRAGDLVLIADRAGRAIGAAWFRLWTSEAHSYGFVDEKTPELGLAVAQGFRGQGIGRLLLHALIARAAQSGYPALSLSVAPTNFARQLYESEGFCKVGEAGTSWTLLRKLREL